MMQMLEPVHEAVGDAGPAGPGVDGGALLAGPHVAHPALVPQVAHLRVVTSGRPVLQHIHIILVVTIKERYFQTMYFITPCLLRCVWRLLDWWVVQC